MTHYLFNPWNPILKISIRDNCNLCYNLESEISYQNFLWINRSKEIIQNINENLLFMLKFFEETHEFSKESRLIHTTMFDYCRFRNSFGTINVKVKENLCVIERKTNINEFLSAIYSLPELLEKFLLKINLRLLEIL